VAKVNSPFNDNVDADNRKTVMMLSGRGYTPDRIAKATGLTASSVKKILLKVSAELAKARESLAYTSVK